jgi:hypothetical protein
MKIKCSLASNATNEYHEVQQNKGTDKLKWIEELF